MAPILTRVLVKQVEWDTPSLDFLEQFPSWKLLWPTPPIVFVARQKGRAIQLSSVEIPAFGEQARLPKATWQQQPDDARAAARINQACAAKARAGYAELLYDTRRERVWSIDELRLYAPLLVGDELVAALADTAARLRPPTKAITRVLVRESRTPTGRPADVFIVRQEARHLDVEEVKLRKPVDLAKFQNPTRRTLPDEATARAVMSSACEAKLGAGYQEFVYDTDEERVRCETNDDLWPRPFFTENIDDALFNTARLQSPKHKRKPKRDPYALVAALAGGTAEGTNLERYVKALAVTSGRITIFDPYHPFVHPLRAKIPNGTYDLTLAVSKDRSSRPRAVTIVLRDERPTSWEPAGEVAVDVAAVAISDTDVAWAMTKLDPLPTLPRLPRKGFAKVRVGAAGYLAIGTGFDGTFPIYFGKANRQLVCITLVLESELANELS